MLKYDPRDGDCIDWLNTADLERSTRFGENTDEPSIQLIMEKGDERAMMWINTTRGTSGQYNVITNIPNTNVKACKLASFTLEGKSVPNATKNFLKEAGIGNPKRIEA